MISRDNADDGHGNNNGIHGHSNDDIKEISSDSYIKTSQFMSDKGTSIQTKSYQIMSSPVRSSQVKSDQVRTTQKRSEPMKINENH